MECVVLWYSRLAPGASRPGWHIFWLCRKFSFEAICGMISLHDQPCISEEHDDGDQFQRGPFPVIRKNYGNELLTEGHYAGLDHL